MSADPGVLWSCSAAALVLESRSEVPGDEQEQESGEAAEEGDQADTDSDHGLHPHLGSSLDTADHHHLCSG